MYKIKTYKITKFIRLDGVNYNSGETITDSPEILTANFIKDIIEDKIAGFNSVNLVFENGVEMVSSEESTHLYSSILNENRQASLIASEQDSLKDFIDENIEGREELDVLSVNDITGKLESSILIDTKTMIGWQDYADSNTSEASPLIQNNISGGEVQLTNNNNDTATDGNTNVNSATTVLNLNDIWDTSTNTFIFKDTGLEKNDLFNIRFHLNINANIISQNFDVRIDFYDQPAGAGNYIFSLSKRAGDENESAGVFREDFINIDGYFGESILDGSAKVYLVGTKSFEVEVIGWKINILKIAR